MVTLMTEPGAHAQLRTMQWRWIALIWSAVGLVDACQTVLFVHTLGQQRPLLVMFGTEFVSWLPLALATPFISDLARRYPIARGANLATLAVHLATFAAVSVMAEAWYVGLQVIFNPWAYPDRLTFADAWRASLPYQLLTYLVVYGLITAVTAMLDARDAMARKITAAARLDEELSKAQLAVLRGQMEPHFMFNTLNAIAGLVRDERNDAAVTMIVGLSDFLRRTLEDSGRTEVTLAEEVAYLERYLAIQKIRFGDRLAVTMDIPAALLRAQVPNLLLQPLVENAIKHGIAKRVAGGHIRVAAARQDGSLRLSIVNDGAREDWQAAKPGVGIANLRTRLQILHAGNFALELRRAGSDSVEAVVTLPFAEA